MTTRINKDEDPMNVARTVLPEPKTALELDSSELATVLAALRLFQREYEDMDATSIADAWPMHFNVQVNPEDEDESTVVPEPLGSMDIDKLCEKINVAPEPKRRKRTRKSGVEYLAQHPGWKTTGGRKALTKTELAAHAFRSHTGTLVEYLLETHEAELETNHHGDGPDGCSYCMAMKSANKALTKYATL